MEKSNSTEMLRRAFRELMKTVSTCLPGHILAFDPATQLAQVQLGIVTTLKDGSTVNPQPLIEVPVYFFGGAFSVECQIDPNTEGLVIFSQRCIDGWLNTGGIAENPILRFHDHNDAFFLPGMRSQPNALQDFSNNGVRLRNADGTSYLWLKNDGTAEFKVTSIKIEGDAEVTGKLDVTGDVTGAGISLSTHVHNYVDTQPNGSTVTKATEVPTS